MTLQLYFTRWDLIRFLDPVLDRTVHLRPFFILAAISPASLKLLSSLVPGQTIRSGRNY